jgi:hypothetical protein
VHLKFTTEVYPVAGVPQRPKEPELALARNVLRNLDEVLASARLNYLKEYVRFQEFLEGTSHPTVWICRETQEGQGEDRWSFVVELKTAPDFGTHLEFRGLEFLELWAGD